MRQRRKLIQSVRRYGSIKLTVAQTALWLEMQEAVKEKAEVLER